MTLNAKYLIAICELIVYKMWELRRLTTQWASKACYSLGVGVEIAAIICASTVFRYKRFTLM
jgi:hypothetical protein